jgi:thiol-disulfide isomerase/thioredoxin
VVNLDATDTKPVINRVTFDNWQIEACPHHGPDMAIDSQDRLHLFWFTGLAERGGLFYGRYDQTAQQLEHQINIDASPSASRPQVVVMDDQIILVWKVLEDEQTTLKLKTSVDQGETWSATTTLMTTESGSDHPLLFAHNDKVFVSWWTEKEGFQLITLNSNEPGSLRPFNKESISEIENNYKGKDFLLVLWSLDCPPCFKEMELLSALNKQGELPELILVSTDGSEFIPEIISVLKQYGLDRVENRYFNDTPELLRMKIDSNWFGELPRSYFYNNNGDRISHSGVLNQAIIAEWFN